MIALKNYRPIVICLCCTLVIFCSVGLAVNIFPIFSPYIISSGQLSHAQMSSLYSIRNLFSLFSLSLLSQKYYAKLGLRGGIALAIGCLAVAFVILGTQDSYFACCLAMSFCGVAHGLGGMVPVSMLMNQWGGHYTATAIGLCGAGSGIATIVAPTLLTRIIERHSLHAAFVAVAIFAVFVSAIAFSIIREQPKCTPRGNGAENEKCQADIEKFRSREVPKSKAILRWMLFALFMLGGSAYGGYQHLGIHFTTEGFSPNRVAFFISVGGLVLTIGKSTYGWIVDKLGAYKTGYFFFFLCFAGWVMCCFVQPEQNLFVVTVMAIINCGLPIGTIGLPIFAKDMTSAENYPKTLRNFQTAYTLGGLFFVSIPGMIADVYGDYKRAFALIAILTFVSAGIIQSCYLRGRKQHE